MKTLVLGMAMVISFPVCLRAAPAKPALEVVVLGSGGPRAFGGAGSSYMVLVGGRPRILLDAGPGAFLRIGELDLDLDKVDTVLLTHLHIDHSGDLAAFFNARALTSDGQSGTVCSARTGPDYSPRPRDLWTCWWEATARLRIKRRLARRNQLPFAIWQSAWIQNALRLWMRMD